MIARAKLLNKLRELGYKYQRQTEKVQLYRKKGGTHYVQVRRKGDEISDENATVILMQCGLSQSDAKKFVGQCKC